MGKGSKNDVSIKRSYTRWPARALAVVLVIALISGVFVYEKTELPKYTRADTTEMALAAAYKILSETDYGRASRIERMRMYLANLVGRGRSYKDYETATAIAIAEGDYEAAAENAEKSLLACTDETFLGHLYLRTGYLYALTENKQNACEYIELGLKTENDAAAYIVLAGLKFDQGNMLSALVAISKYEDSVSDEDKWADAYALPIKANAYYNLKDFHGANECIEQLIEAGNTSKSVYFVGAVSAYELGNDQAAIERALKCISTDEADGETTDGTLLSETVLKAARRLNDYYGAEAYFTKAIGLDDKDIENYYLRGLCRMSNLNYNGAKEDFAKCEALGEKIITARKLLEELTQGE